MLQFEVFGENGQRVADPIVPAAGVAKRLVRLADQLAVGFDLFDQARDFRGVPVEIDEASPCVELRVDRQRALGVERIAGFALLGFGDQLFELVRCDGTTLGLQVRRVQVLQECLQLGIATGQQKLAALRLDLVDAPLERGLVDLGEGGAQLGAPIESTFSALAIEGQSLPASRGGRANEKDPADRGSLAGPMFRGSPY